MRVASVTTPIQTSAIWLPIVIVTNVFEADFARPIVESKLNHQPSEAASLAEVLRYPHRRLTKLHFGGT